MKAVWNGEVIAEADDEEIIEIEGNSYFPPDSVNKELLTETDAHTECPWKGTASYYDITVDGETNEQAAWYYPQPKEGSEARVGQPFAHYIAFWHGVEVS